MYIIFKVSKTELGYPVLLGVQLVIEIPKKDTGLKENL